MGQHQSYQHENADNNELDVLRYITKPHNSNDLPRIKTK